jgi:hypothetical protein
MNVLKVRHFRDVDKPSVCDAIAILKVEFLQLHKA